MTVESTLGRLLFAIHLSHPLVASGHAELAGEALFGLPSEGSPKIWNGRGGE